MQKPLEKKKEFFLNSEKPLFGWKTVSEHLSFLSCFDNYICQMYNLEQNTINPYSLFQT